MSIPKEMRTAVDGLTEAVVSPPDRNDLGRLARMHSWCQALSGAESITGDGPSDEAIRAIGAALVPLLEGLILDELPDPDGVLSLIAPTAIMLQEAIEQKPVDVPAIVAPLAAALDGGTGPSSGEASTAAAQAAPAASEATAPEAAPRPVAESPAAGGGPGVNAGGFVSEPVVSVPLPSEAPTSDAANTQENVVVEAPPAASAVEAAPPTAAAGPSSGGAAGGGGDDEEYVSEPLILDLEEPEHLEGFIDESHEHMDVIEVALLEVEQAPNDPSKINELFRPFHTIKGIAGFLNLRDINRLTHEIETLLDMGRKGELTITSDHVDLIFSGVDVLKTQLAALQQYMKTPTGDACPQPDIRELMRKLRRAVRGESVGGSAAPPPAQSAAPDEAGTTPQADVSVDQASRPKLGEVLVHGGLLNEDELDEALELQKSAPATGKKLGELLVEEQAISKKQLDKALEQQSSGMLEQSIRVDIGKLDILIDAVGELVIAQTMVNQNDQVLNNAKLARDVSQVTKIVRDVQETAMAMRMVPIGQTFQKMKRLVRDVSRKGNKQVHLEISGEDTELDKTVIQQISDPLVHMVRNAVDHGIESPEGRVAAGKPEAGTVWLDAHHQGDSIVIEIRDDGKGLDREKIIAKGIERGLIGPDEQLSEQQAFALVMQAGFSTADKVTDISGRGVGMDVVRRNIEQLRGKIEISSEKGKGSTFAIRLPLTLAIIDGMLVRVGPERVVIPTILIEQSLKPEPSQITTVQQRGEMIQVRGELCPLVQLGPLFGYSHSIDPCERLVVIAHCEGRKIGLVVDELIGQQQVVIKSLGDRFKHTKGLSGAAILGDGRVGLILEPTGILALHNDSRSGFAGRSRALNAKRAEDECHVSDFASEACEAVAEQTEFASEQPSEAAVAADPAEATV